VRRRAGASTFYVGRDRVGVYQSPQANATATDALREFANLPLWVTWQYEFRQGNKPTKVPYAPCLGRRASTTDDSTWATRAIAMRAAEEEKRDGVGLVLAPLDEGRHLGGIDLDSCIDDEGNVAPWAREIVELVAIYTEAARRGQGLKIFFPHDPREPGVGGRGWKNPVRRPPPNGGKEPAIELYLDRHYFAVTDQIFESFDPVQPLGMGP